jgi:chromate transporter
MVKHNGSLTEIAAIFLTLGVLAFGGPAAHIAMMEDIVVKRKGWMSRQHFLDLIGATNLIPGPNSTEMAMHCGYERGGRKGLLIAGTCFIFPAVVITGVLAALYLEYGSVPKITPFLYGIKPAVLAIILGAIIKLGRNALKNLKLGIVGCLVLVATLFGVNEITAILAAGVLGLLMVGLPRGFTKNRANWMPVFTGFLTAGGTAIGTNISSTKLFLVFLKIGAVLFGSGYVLIAYLDTELVHDLGWLTKLELLDAIAIGQFTPGPVLSTATFIGYQIDGWQGAIVATLGIFLPSFFYVWLLNPVIPRLRRSALARGFLDAVNIAAVAIMMAVTYRLGHEILIDWRAWFIALLSLGVTFIWKKAGSFYLVLGGAVLGYLLLNLEI